MQMTSLLTPAPAAASLSPSNSYASVWENKPESQREVYGFEKMTSLWVEPNLHHFCT